MTNEQIITDYPITDDMRQASRVRKRWQFSKFNVGMAWITTDHNLWMMGRQAARQVASRKGYKFNMQWNENSRKGAIVRVQ